MTDAVKLAESVLVADGQPFATLSLAQGLPPVTVDTAVADARRNYMRLAGAIHPDRLQGSFDKATEAFQCLVRAFECFADPKSRKKAAAEAAKEAIADKSASTMKTATKTTEGAAGFTTTTTPPTASLRKQPKKVEKQKKGAERPSKKQIRKGESATKKRSRKVTGLDGSVDEEEESEDDEEEDEKEASATEEEAWEEWAAADTEPEVSTSRSPIGQLRTGELYQLTTVGCPKCRTQWEPDAKPQYSLFMGHWGKKVHCQLCLFEFGCATALHNCPHCSAPFDYDVSMYDEVQTCKKCGKQFGFPYYPVNQHLIDQIALEEWRERKDREKAAEREARARARRGVQNNVSNDDKNGKGGKESEQAQLLIGTCVVDETCPLCHRRVKSQHRSHVLACMTKSPEERAAAEMQAKQPKAKVAKAVRNPTPKKSEIAAVTAAKGGPATTAKKKSVPAKKATPKKAAPKQTQRKRRRGGSSSSSSDEDEDFGASLSESEDDDFSSESSFSEDDDDSN